MKSGLLLFCKAMERGCVLSSELADVAVAFSTYRPSWLTAAAAVDAHADDDVTGLVKGSRRLSRVGACGTVSTDRGAFLVLR